MVYKISWDLGRLPWQPNLGKKCTHHFFARNREIFRIYGGDFWVGEFQYPIRIFKGANGVAMATKFGQKMHSSVPCKKSRNFSHVQLGFWDW